MKDAKVKKAKKTKSLRFILRRYVAKPVAYTTLFILAAYGVRQVLDSIDQKASIVITTLTVLALVYIIFDES